MTEHVKRSRGSVRRLDSIAPTKQLCSAGSSEATLQRLPEPSLKQRSKRPADMDTVTAAQDEIEFPVGGRLQMQNAVDVDDGRAMHANEAARIEPSDEFAEGGA